MSGPIMSTEQCQALFDKPSVEAMRQEPALASFVGYVFSRAGYFPKLYAGAGANYQLFDNAEMAGNPSAYVLVRTSENRVGAGDVVMLRGRLSANATGYLISRSGFNEEAIRDAALAPTIHLIDIGSLQRYVRYIRGTYFEQTGATPLAPDRILHPIARRLTSQTKVLSLANNKGGVGKTTTALNLAFGLASKNMNVLVVDLDAQSNATQALLREVTTSPHIADYFAGRANLSDTIKPTQFDRVWVIPSHPTLRFIHPSLSALPDVEAKFAADLHSQLMRPRPEGEAHFDWVILDTPPAIGIQTRAALAASHYILAPATPSNFAGSGLRQLIETADAASALTGGSSRILGCVITQWQDVAIRSDAVKAIESALHSIHVSLLDTRIPFDQNIEKAHQEEMRHGINLFGLGRRPSPGAKAYHALLEEVLGSVDND